MKNNLPTTLAATLLAFLRANITITNIIAPDKITYTRELSPDGDTINGVAILTGRIMNSEKTGENSRVSLPYTKMRNINEAINILTTTDTQERLLVVTQSDQNLSQPIRLVAFRYDDLDWLIDNNPAISMKTQTIDNDFYDATVMDSRLIGCTETSSIISNGIAFDFAKYDGLMADAVMSATIQHATLDNSVAGWTE